MASETERSTQIPVSYPTADSKAVAEQRPRKLLSRINILIRRVHLYSGLFLLPWVILYGVTGAMFNHQGLFPRIVIQPVDEDVVANSPMSEFPTAGLLAEQVVEALRTATGNKTIRLPENNGAEFTGDLTFEVKQSGEQHVVHIDPIEKSSWIGTQPRNEEEPVPLLTDVKQIQLSPDPHAVAQRAAEQILQQSALKSSGKLQPLGWTKLNFLVNINGEAARVTYVLKDGHVDVNRYTGEDGFPLRQFLLRLHTSHGQPPHWNSRMFWSLAVDTMSIAMVCWGLSGVFMWWQIKRTRILGAFVIAISLLTATAMWFGLQSFYAATRL